MGEEGRGRGSVPCVGPRLMWYYVHVCVCVDECAGLFLSEAREVCTHCPVRERVCTSLWRRDEEEPCLGLPPLGALPHSSPPLQADGTTLPGHLRGVGGGEVEACPGNLSGPQAVTLTKP